MTAGLQINGSSPAPDAVTFGSISEEQLISMVLQMFRRLCAAGILSGEDPRTMALDFYGPVFLLLRLCDHAPEKIPEAEEMLQKHLHQFNAFHREETKT